METVKGVAGVAQNRRCRRCEMIRMLLVATTLMIFAALFSVAHAGDSWWQKGTEVLKQIATPAATQGTGLGQAEIAAGLKEALSVGTERVVSQLGQTDGFNSDPAIHIPLPESLARVQSTLNTVGMGGMMNDLELKLNRAAEEATPHAKELFINAISQMTLDDVTGIYNGPEDAATQYFRGKMSDPLREKMRPIVENSLAQVGAVQTYDNVMSQYRQIPFVPDVKADLQNHVLDRGLDGIFHYVAQEEAAIRSDPAARTTELLQKVFGAKGAQ